MSYFQPQHIQLITNPQELDKIDEILSWAIRSQVKPRHRLEIILFKLPEWVAVPISYEDYPTPYLHQICQILLRYGYQELHHRHSRRLYEPEIIEFFSQNKLQNLEKYVGNISN